MTFPNYKKIAINSHQKRLIYSQLDQLDFGHQPYIFEMSHLVQNQQETLTNIESYLFEHEINVYSYPIIVIADVQNYTGNLNIVEDISKCPSFFKHKSRQLTAKEANKLNEVELKQTHLNNMQKNDFEPIISEYARSHKVISTLHRENEFLKTLEKRLHII